MSEPSTSASKQDFDAICDEIRGCDRCYRKYYNLLQKDPDAFTGTSPGGSRNGPKQKKNVGDKLTVPKNWTTGSLVEAGPLGESILKLAVGMTSAKRGPAKSIANQRRQAQYNILLCERYAENSKKAIKELVIELRQHGILERSSEEYTKAVNIVKQKFRKRLLAVEQKSQNEVESLRKQLDADADFEEQQTALKVDEMRLKRCSYIDELSREIDYRRGADDMEVVESEVVDVHCEEFNGTVALPINKKTDEAMKRLEKKELQNFLLYARAPERVGKRRKVKVKSLSVDSLPVTGAFFTGCSTDAE